ncbi:uncharacterized protein LOC127289623 [Leptopilina boulardi]|uniref:uncharacterized protein LOC127289623 n=1 Tax=Leptopilina boulardi TaxID=63433 RepID=UPI0021F686FC|nr:uncharacterized protein LOC127289623 [Leptopilina boulardi]
MERKFKFALLLTLTCTSVRSLDEKILKEELLESAAAQLERLAPFRQAKQFTTNDLIDNSRNHFFYHSNKTRNREKEKEMINEKNEKLDEFQFPLQLLKILGGDINNNNKNNNNNSPIKEPMGFQFERRGDSNTFDANPNSLQDANFDLFLQERIKRSGSNSGSFISGIASKVIGGIAGASSGLSKGSSSSSDSSHSYGNTAYGPPVYSYEQQSFNAWDFKKAILNTVFQAIKAISGGVLALKGQLIKGGGFLISTKGRLISSTGEAISNLGRNIASSTYVVAPKPVYTQTGYAYNPPSSQSYSHTDSFEGPPPSSHDYSSAAFEDSYHPQNTFGAASDDDVQAGLVIMTPSQSNQLHHDDFSTELDPRHPNIQQALEESFGGSLKGSSTSDIIVNNNNNNNLHSTDDQFSLQELQQFQLPTTKPHLPFVTSLKQHNELLPDNNKHSLEYDLKNQNSNYNVEIPKISPLPISPTNPSNSLHIDYPPHNNHNSNQKPIINFANKFQEIDFSKFNQLIMKNQGFSLDNYPQLINDIKAEPLVSGIPITLNHQESLKIPILNNELPKEHRFYEYQDIGNGPFPLEMFETLDTKKQNEIFGGKLISQSLQVQPAIGYTLQNTGLHRI